MRIALCIEYQGGAYRGWQAQLNTKETVQAYLEGAVSKIANHPVIVSCAGRTDAGVHATYQIVHFDTTTERPLRAWNLGINTLLPRDIRVQWAQVVSEQFQARYSACARTYHYLLTDRPVASAIARECVTWELHPLNAELMHQACQYWLGEHDFTSFRAMSCQAKHPIRAIKHTAVSRQGPLVIFTVTGNAFLQHMVRNMVGVLLPIGRGDTPVEWAKTVLEAKDRTAGGITAPPNGLYLTGVAYPEALNGDFLTKSALPWLLSHP